MLIYFFNHRTIHLILHDESLREEILSSAEISELAKYLNSVYPENLKSKSARQAWAQSHQDEFFHKLLPTLYKDFFRENTSKK